MKYQLLLLPLLTSAVLAATSESRFAAREPTPAETVALAATPHAPHEVEHAAHDPHAGHDDPHAGHDDPHAGHDDSHAGHDDPHAGHDDSHAGHDVEHGAHDPHAGLYGSDADPHAGLYGDDSDPHAGAHAATRAPDLPKAIARSSAANGRTVAEIFSERAALNEKPVRLRATVVKLTEGILGKTYLHLQDGSGSAARDNHDLTATTTEPFEVGETVEVQGQLAIDQDVGVGYRYAALLIDLTRVRSD